MGAHLTLEQKQMVRRLRANGLPLNVIARDIGCKPDTVGITARGSQLRPGKPAEWVPGPGRLGVIEREEIILGLARDDSMSAIARRLGRSPSTITREVAANGAPGLYGAWRAHCRAREATRGDRRRPG